MGTPEKNKDMEEAVKKVNENPKYKVLTKEEYEILMGGAVPKTSTPRLPLDPKTPKVLFGPTIPGATPTRMQQIMGKLANQSGKAANLSLSQSFANVPSYNSPKLPFLVAQRSRQREKQAMRSGNMKSSVFRSPISQNICCCTQYAIRCGEPPGICLFLWGKTPLSMM